MTWLYAMILGIPLAITLTLAIMSIILLRSSTNKGDVRSDIGEYSIGVMLTNKESFGPIEPGKIFDSYSEVSMTMLTQEKSMAEYARHKLEIKPVRPVERYFPKSDT